MSINPHEIPDIVIGRLPIYLRALTRLSEQGQTLTSSLALGQLLGISSAQIRKDLSFFGGFGKQGTGYQVKNLLSHIRHILHLEREWPMIVVGAGNLGRAIAHYGGFVERGFRVVAVFDNDPAKIGDVVGNLTVRDVRKIQGFVQQQAIQVALIAVPEQHAQQVSDMLVEAGVLAILNYAPTVLKTPLRVHIHYIDPVSDLQHLTYYLD